MSAADSRRSKVDLGRHRVLAGDHQFTLTVGFRSDFSANMHHYEWRYRESAAVELPAGGSVALVSRFYEEEADDPRQRMRIQVSFEPSGGTAASDPTDWGE